MPVSWDAVLDEQTTVSDLNRLTAKTLVVSDKATQRPIQQIVEILTSQCPGWSFRFIEQAGHMAALTQPQIINPIVRDFFDEN